MATRIKTAHDVEEEQFEPGVPLALQPRVHHVDLTMSTVLVRGSLAVSRRVAVEVEVPLRSVETGARFEDAQGIVRSDFSSIHHRNETVSGLGDVAIAARIRLVPAKTRTDTATSTTADGAPSRWLVDLVAGVSAPTGGLEDDPFERGARGLDHQHVFFGSGTWNPQIQAEAHRRGRRADLYGWLGGSGALSENERGYQRGLSASAGAGLSSSFGLTRTSFQGQLEIDHSEPSSWRSQDERNSGRTDLVAALGASFRVAEALILQAQLRMPSNLRSRGGVLEPKTVLLAGVSYSFQR